jgi:hypothetical protein
MKMNRLVLGTALLLWLPAAAAAQAIDTLEIRAHTRFLADDLLLGRGAGTPGENVAAAYIEAQLMRLGLRPAGAGDGFLQPVPLRRVRLDSASTLTVGDAALKAEQDFTLNLGSLDAFRSFGGQAWFVGDAIQARTAFEGMGSLAGRVAVLAGFAAAESAELLASWHRRGLEGVLLVVPDEAEFRRIAAARGPARYAVDADLAEPVWQPRLPALIAGPAALRGLLDGAELPAAFYDGQPFPALELDARVDAQVRVAVEAPRAWNVAGVLSGHDPRLADEFVVMTAHLDHLGVGPPDARGDSIYSGFSDNAAGVAMLLAIAAALRDEPPARSVLFLFPTAEERGLLGSGYYAAHPLVPLEQTRAVINIDAGAPPAPPVHWRVAGAPDLALAERAARVAEAAGWSAEIGPARANSDHWPFALRGIPAVFLIPGTEWEGVDDAARALLVERWERYHRPGDVWSHDFPWAGVKRYAEFGLRVLLEVAGR